MKRFVEGIDRNQATLFPECLEDCIAEDNPVRVIDAFVDALNLGELRFAGVDPKATGRPSYHPSIMLKLYVYGYLNTVQSSRRLEREAGRNIELMWLLGRLIPDHKTIADFRKNNGTAIKKVCAQFIELCRQLGLLTKASVAIDGSKFKAVNNRDRNFTKNKVKRRRIQIEESIDRYLRQLDSTDRQEPTLANQMKTTRLKEKVVKLGEEMKRLKNLEAQMLETPDEQISLTDPDSRSMATSGRGTGVVGYNVQSSVDTEHHLIVTHEVTMSGSDRSQLAPMARQTMVVLDVEELDVVADRGYFSSQQILECEQIGVAVTLPKPQTSQARTKGFFAKTDFRYVPDNDTYICPANEVLAFTSHKRERNGLNLRRYACETCAACKLKHRCTTSTNRAIVRWEHEEILEKIQERLDLNSQAMRVRRETVEHPFGTIKARMGATHFLMKTLPKVATEMALHVLAYNLTRVINIIGIKPLIAAIKEFLRLISENRDQITI